MSPLLSPSILLAVLVASNSTTCLFANEAHFIGATPHAPVVQDKLSRIVARHLEQVVKYLDLADKAVAAKDAKGAVSNLEQAETQWKTFHEWNKGKFDPKHADVVAAGKRMEATRKAVARISTKEPDTPTKSTPQPKQTMSRIVSKHLEKVERLIQGMEDAVKKKDVAGAKDSLRYAEAEWKAFREWNKGKYDPKDPRVVAATHKMESVTAKIKSLSGEAEDMSKVLSVVLAVILDNEKQLQAAVKTAGYSLRSFESSGRDYRHIAKARKELLKLPGEMAIVNDRLLESVAVCRDFRKQIPSMDDLNKLVRNGRQAERALKRVEAAPKDWLRELSRVTKQSLDMAEENIANYEKKLQGIGGLPENRKVYVANNAYEWAVDHADVMLQVVPSAFLELTAEGKQTFPDYVKARNGFVARASALEGRSKRIAAQVGKVRKQIVDAAAKRIDGARFPKTEYTGTKWKEAEAEIRKAFTKKIGDKELLRVAIDSPWQVRREARWRNNTWVISTYRYIGAYCAAKLESGKCYVYHMSFRRTQQADGGWSALEQWSVGHVYEIAEKNIGK
jgi:hypothetical protein